MVVLRIQRHVSMVQQCVVARFQMAGQRVHSIVVLRFDCHDYEVQQCVEARAIEVNRNKTSCFQLTNPFLF